MAAAFAVSTARLRLRPLRAEDAAAFHAAVTRPEIGRMLFRFPQDWTREAAEAFMGACAFSGRPRFRLAIAAPDGAFLGSIGLSDEDDPAAPEVFYFLVPEAAGQGHAQEALAAFSAALFARFPRAALSADVFTDNPASIRVLERCGYLRRGEGRFKSPARLEPAPVWHYRLDRPFESIAP